MSREEVAVGDAVEVGLCYRGAGYSSPDEFTGRGWYVVGVLRHGGLDYKLARHSEDPWEVIVHHSRVTKVTP